jgi:tRNA A37 methylthiotransferase MiaB
VNVQRFISSGIVELYVAGMATEEEARELEAAMAQFPDLAAEVEACRRDMEHYIRLQAIAPPPTIKDHLLRIVADEATECNNNE